jgi:hypothetical protein
MDNHHTLWWPAPPTNRPDGQILSEMRHLNWHIESIGRQIVPLEHWLFASASFYFQTGGVRSKSALTVMWWWFVSENRQHQALFCGQMTAWTLREIGDDGAEQSNVAITDIPFISPHSNSTIAFDPEREYAMPSEGRPLTSKSHHLFRLHLIPFPSYVPPTVPIMRAGWVALLLLR